MSKLIVSPRLTLILAAIAVGMTGLDGVLLAALGPIGGAAGAAPSPATMRLGLLGGLMLPVVAACTAYMLLCVVGAPRVALPSRAVLWAALRRRSAAIWHATPLGATVAAPAPAPAPAPIAKAAPPGTVLTDDYNAAVTQLRSTIRLLMTNTKAIDASTATIHRTIDELSTRAAPACASVPGPDARKAS